ncbi:CPBP family intramembrane metalloprotease [Nonomuraea longispora]|uniref:CPBP family intramembrane metalloprotease n=1 Tax=Nonomuraea longispora TaxID=1848320 RepID=A0A4R4N694_9ACTN|nr:CPBP family intramembrane glutamic endopeptidase [Nonomuraea longispora]TDC03494.1 CPBP family intramembrane metalloprotease [Nonomuraea longispora]
MQENPGPHFPYGAPPPAHPYPPPRPSWFLPTPRGARYDHLARTAASHPWRAIVGTLVIAAGFFTLGVVVVFAGMVVALIAGIPFTVEPSGQLSGNPVFSLVVLLMTLAPMILLVYGTVALIQRRRPGTISSVAGRLRWSWMARCAGLAVLALAAGQGTQMLVMSAGGDDSEMFGWGGWEGFLPALIVIVLLVPFQAAAEEYVFRGWFVQAVGAHVRNPIWSILVGAALFASLHGYQPAGLVDVFVFGAAMGWLTVRTGGLEAAIALHVMNNLLAFGLSAAAGSLEEALDQPNVPVPWQALLGTLVQLVVYMGGVLYLAKKRSISTVSA